MLLSRKQKWRRASSSQCRKSTIIPLNELRDSILALTDNESILSSSRSTSYQDGIGFSEKLKLEEVSLESNVSRKSIKNVRFSGSVHVVLIPTREELQHLHSNLYYSCDECKTFCEEATEELLLFLSSPSFSSDKMIHLTHLHQECIKEFIQAPISVQTKCLLSNSAPKTLKNALKETFHLLYQS